jgi:hypothetical protein
MKEAQHHFPNEPRLTFAENQTGALEGADAIGLSIWRLDAETAQIFSVQPCK